MKWTDFLNEKPSDQLTAKVLQQSQSQLAENRVLHLRKLWMYWTGTLTLGLTTAGLAALWNQSRGIVLGVGEPNQEIFLGLIENQLEIEDLDFLAELELIEDLDELEEWTEEEV